jgi:NADH:ubiquinone oxidoreductase subunit F (NADH-binding)/(2Fe-2S) ferredoxin/NAD-dependent dihydropyrimidine dehydrogenase PreA subunit
LHRLTSVEELEKTREAILQVKNNKKVSITVCLGTGCHANAGRDVYERLQQEIASHGLTEEIELKPTGCRGFCEQGPIVVIYPGELCYCRVKPEHAADIIKTTVLEKKIIEELLYKDPVTGQKYGQESEIPFYRNQNRIILGANRFLNPQDIRDYLAQGGYRSLAKVLTSMAPEQVIAEIKKADLRGRGGGGFPAGLKWETTRNTPADKKYVIVNADEGDPGAYMDRSLLEGNPHLILEGLAIGAYAIGAGGGFVYVRQEYPLALENLSIAIRQAGEYGLLGTNILGTGFNFHVRIKRGAGAFVSGESSALMSAIEGKVGQPRPKHINTAISGINGKPSNLNNVETWANVPVIIEKGADWYTNIGSYGNKGTKIFSLVGKVYNTGLVEVPLGTPLRKIIYEIGGGIPGGKQFKAVQTGGPSGGCLPAAYLDTPVDFDHLQEMGSMMGSGGMIVMDEDNCMVDVAKYFMHFLKGESCGKCISCREGTARMYEILEAVTQGRGQEEDLLLLEELAWAMANTSLCALGRTAANPVLSTLKYFREEYEAHIREKRCPAKICKVLINYTIDPQKCNGCGRCQKLCPAGAVEGEAGSSMAINVQQCQRCGICREACRFGAVTVTSP